MLVKEKMTVVRRTISAMGSVCWWTFCIFVEQKIN